MGKKVTVDLDKLKAALYDDYVQRFVNILTIGYSGCSGKEDTAKAENAAAAGFLATNSVIYLMLELDESGGE